MKTPAGRECPHFHGDYFRGRNVEECRLLKAQGELWSPDLCKTCPVPDIARANSCQFMKLKVRMARPFTAFFQRRALVTAYCEKTMGDVPEPQVGCGECHALPFTFEVKE
ncbi:MAG: hypothetical protein IH589_10445 [Anaerolineales bacterium]|nr:hypothetical protein [Anaerolineales bacterium]